MSDTFLTVLPNEICCGLGTQLEAQVDLAARGSVKVAPSAISVEIMAGCGIAFTA
jgi:hypothetical protein